MTHGTAFEYFDTLCDKSGAPWHDGAEKEYLVHKALCEWIKTHYRDYEEKEKRREDLDLILVRKKSFLNLSIIDLTSSVDFAFFLIVALSGSWDFICKGKVTTRNLAIRPIKHDELAELSNDPFNCPTDAFPCYTQYHDDTKSVIQIYSDNTPKTIELVYIKTPEKILDSTPLAVCELPDWAMYEVLEHAVRTAFAIVENYQRYQAQAQGEIPAYE